MRWLMGAMLGCVLGASPLASGQTPSPAPEAQDNPRCAPKAAEWAGLQQSGASADTQRVFASALPAFCPGLAARIRARVDADERAKASAAAASSQEQRASLERLRSDNASLRYQLDDAQRKYNQAKSELESAKNASEAARQERLKVAKALLRPLADIGSDVETAAKAANWNALGNLGVPYHNGGGGKAADYYVAMRLNLMACDMGQEHFCGNLGMELNFMLDSDFALTKRYLDRGCVVGNAPACSALASKYHYGSGVAKDKDEAIRYYRLAIKRDPANAQAVAGLKDLGASP